MKEIVQALRGVVSPDRAMEHVRRITLNHRIQSSPGYRAAAEYCRSALEAAGLESRILSYCADGEQKYLEDTIMREWSCTDARLTLCVPHEEVLCDFTAAPLCISQRSCAADFREEGLDIVSLPLGSTRESCRDVDLHGKLVLMDIFTRDGARWLFEEKGAAGLLTDRVQEDAGLRGRPELYDCLCYHSFPFDTTNEREVGGWAFAITPRQGDRLRKLCADMKAAYEKDPSLPPCPRAKGYIDAAFYDGSIENVLCTIPGKSDEAVLLVAHLCHPQPCANDNASGCAGAMEAMRALGSLISSGRLPQPQRTIRMLLVPEMTGTNAYLAGLGEEGRKKVIAGVNLDMIGAKQDGTSGPVVAFRTPQAGASLVNELAAMAIDAANCDHSALGHPSEFVGMHNFAIRAFSTGSDHQILSDPLIDIPCVSFTQWPDLFYHTSGDTVERIDPTLIAKVAAIAGGMLWQLANMDEREADLLLARAGEDYAASLRREVELWQQKGENAQQLVNRLAFAEESAAWALQNLQKLYPGALSAEMESVLRDERAKLEALKEQTLRRALALHGMTRPQPASAPIQGARPKLIRTFAGDADGAKIKALIAAEGSDSLMAQHEKNRSLESCILYWTCGRYDFEEIAERAVWENGGGDKEYVGQFLRILNRGGLVKAIPNA